MPSTRELRRRIRSVKSTRQITKAMELVSAAKMRRASEATLSSRPYALRAWQVLEDLTGQPEEKIAHPLLAVRPVQKVLVFLIASDRGLAGSYNANLIKMALSLAKEQAELGRELSFITMGRRAETALLKAGLSIAQSYPHTPMHPTSRDVLPISKFLTQSFLSGSADQVFVLYTEFHSMLRQEARLRQLLPLQTEVIEAEAEADKATLDKEHSAHQSGERFFLYEPNPVQVLDYVLPRLIDVQVYQSLQESLASEHSARRMAMKNATDNASDMIDDLTLTYNGVRQGNITREIAEITSGAAALEK